MTAQKTLLVQVRSEGNPLNSCARLSKCIFARIPLFTCLCRESEATANLGAVLTGSTLVTMFVVRKLGLTLAELDDVTSGTTTTAEAKANLSAFGGSTAADAGAAGGVERHKDL